MRISVGIPCCNHGAYIAQAITSCLDQGWPDLDLIVIDDGSKDKSAEIVRSLLASRGGFRFLARENRGLIATLNQLVAMADGDAFCLLASDDFLPPDSLATRARFLLDHPDHLAVFGDGQIIGRSAPASLLGDKQRRLFRCNNPIPDFLRGTNLPIHTMLVRMEVFRRIGGFDPRYRRCEDLDVQLLLFLEGKIGFIDSPLYCYREHEENVSRVHRQIARVDKVLCYRKYLEEIPALVPYRKLIRYRLRRQYLLLARYLWQIGGGDAFERELVSGGWTMAWQDPRLLSLLVLLSIKWRLTPLDARL